MVFNSQLWRSRMFAQLFRRRAARRHHLNRPFLQERLEYLWYFADQGYTLTTLRHLAADLLLIQNLLGLATSSDSISLAAVQSTVNQWVHRRPRHFNHKNGRRGREQLLSRAVRWLRFLGACDSHRRAPRHIVLSPKNLQTTCACKRASLKRPFRQDVGTSKTFWDGSFATTTLCT